MSDENTASNPQGDCGDHGEHPQIYRASIFSNPHETLPSEFVQTVKELEANLDACVWFLVQNGGSPFENIDDAVFKAFKAAKSQLPTNSRMALLLDSPGGQAKSAYQLATLFKRHCSEFVVVIPDYAKSAATLLSLGADSILMGECAELGPLDVQVQEPDRETRFSALDEVHAIQRLNAAALESVDQSMNLLLPRTRKKVDTLLPLVLDFVSGMMRPMVEKIDTVHYTQMSRALKVAEEYSTRLLMSRHDPFTAKQLARHLVENYPEHGFSIDTNEALGIGLQVVKADETQNAIFDVLIPYLDKMTIIGRLQEA